MHPKTKNALTVFLILALSALVIVFVLGLKKNRQNKNESVNTPAEQEKLQTEKEQPKNFSTVFAEGKLVSFGGNKIEIKTGDIINKLDTIENPLIFKKNADKIEKQNPEILKKDLTVKAEVDMSNTKVISVEVLQ